VPKTTLEFSGGLHVPLAKTLELSNPSKKPITYAVRLEGLGLGLGLGLGEP